ncbi:baeRF12 domain-containing protein [Altererythrobacter lutimaris]|uniref:Host attachment protein n=1 Tax=Altererythrobacter lutimaris TaxID=2743979 RepID=A0A850HCP6_9SPHN|nr:host attachment family protein [Altererythrobacter lutimaris]NVE95993.1 host attachment protein [Altererythrobacter lutimaris]
MKLKHGALVMAIDGTKLMLMRNDGDTKKPVLQTIAQEKADNPKTSRQGADRPGRSFSSASPRRSSLGETDLHDEAKKGFAKSALKQLQKHHEDQGGDVIVLAAPSVLGDFRKHCPDSLRSAIIAEIDKDVVNHEPQDIAAIIDALDA